MSMSDYVDSADKSCPSCAVKMRVVHTQSKKDYVERWYRCPKCFTPLRTREKLQIDPPKPMGKVIRSLRDGALVVINPEDVRQMRLEWEKGATIPELALRYGAAETTVSNIVIARTWRHI